MSDRIHLSSPDVTVAEESALVRAIRSGWVAPLGPEVDAFEAELASYCGREHCVVLSSGTAALHLGLLAAGLGRAARQEPCILRPGRQRDYSTVGRGMQDAGLPIAVSN